MSRSPIALEDGWRQIKTGAIDILMKILDGGLQSGVKPFPAREYAQIYTVCYNMCTQRTPHNWSEQLYQRHGQTFRTYLSDVVLPSLQSKHGEQLLQEFDLRWRNHLVMNRWMRQFFMYLDRYHVKHNNLPKLKEAGLIAFRDLVFVHVRGAVVAAMVEAVDAEREASTAGGNGNGNGDDAAVADAGGRRGLLKSCAMVFEAMGRVHGPSGSSSGSSSSGVSISSSSGADRDRVDVYAECLEAPLIAATAAFYRQKAALWVDSDDTPTYLAKAERCLEEESARVQAFLLSATEPRLLAAVVTELLDKHETTLIEKPGSGCLALLSNARHDDLSRLFRLFSRVPAPHGLPPIARLVQRHMETAGVDLIRAREAALAGGAKDSASDPQLVDGLIALHHTCKALVAQQFQDHSLFLVSMKQAFTASLNRPLQGSKHTTAELLSTYCERLLRTGGSASRRSEDEVEAALESVVLLFSYLTDKDLFADIYRNQLAKRLLNNRSASDDAERSMISKLKLRCGAQFTGKLEGMMNDLSLGRDHASRFNAHLAEQEDSELPESFGVQVLTTGYWPTYRTVELTLPPPMRRGVEVFSKYYHSITSHRKLHWVHSLGSAVVRASFARHYDLSVSTLQAAVLTLYNDGRPSSSLEEIQAELGVELEVAKRTMHSLSCGKYKLLLKSPAGKTIGAGDRFAFNDGFSARMRKLRIPMPSLEESHNPEKLAQDRSIAVEAAIVRIMKARKTLSHTQLMTEVLQQLHFFRPKPKVVKRRIEHLIDREYLARDEEQANVYNYLA